LDATDSKKNKRRYWWLGLAASFAGIILIAGFMFNDEKDDIPTVVETEKVQINDQSETNVTRDENTKHDNEAVVASKSVLSKEKNAINEQPTKDSKSKRNLQKVSFDQSKTVAETSALKEEESFDEGPKLNSDLSFEEQKANAVVAEIRALQEGNNAVSEEEIDALLEAAHKEITFHNLLDSSNTVDAEALLRSVEEDLEESFRDRVFKLLQSGYEGVKTVVVERNN
jgi:hypothetical protein